MNTFLKDLSKFIRTVPDYPKPGIMFKDITPLLANAPVFNAVIEVYANHYKDSGIDIVAGPEARGVIFASALAYRIGAGFVPVCKKGKLPMTLMKQPLLSSMERVVSRFTKTIFQKVVVCFCVMICWLLVARLPLR